MNTWFRWTANGSAEGRSAGLYVAVLILFWILISQSGCIVIPIPTPERTVLAGNPVTEEQLAFLAPGITTKSEVMAHLGSPNVIWEDARLFAYNWEMRQGILVWAVGAYYSGAAGLMDIPKRYMLLIQFDDQDRVLRFERAVWPAHKSYGEFLREWIGDSAPDRRENSANRKPRCCGGRKVRPSCVRQSNSAGGRWSAQTPGGERIRLLPSSATTPRQNRALA